MNCEIVVVIEGDWQAVLEHWQPPTGTESKRRGDDLHIVLGPPNSRSELDSLRAAMGKLPAETATIVPFFRAVDPTAADLLAAPAVAAHVFGGPELAVEPLVDCTRCHLCKARSFTLRDVELVNATTRDRVHGTFLDGSGRDDGPGGGAVFAHRDFVRSLRKAGLAASLVTRPVSIRGPDGVSTDYEWMRGALDLGYFAGRAVYDVPCRECGRPELLDCENFLETYPTPAAPFDIGYSSVHGPLRLLLSAAAYHHLVATVSDHDTLVLTPADLVR